MMSHHPECLSPQSTLQEAAKQMQKQDYGFIPICDNDRLVGVVTDRDLATRGIAEGKDPQQTALREVMTKEVHYCFEDDDVEKVAEEMAKQQIRRLVVLNENKRLTGILSLGDMATKNQDKKPSNKVTQAVSQDKQ